MAMAPVQFLSITETAERLSVKRETVARWIREGRLPTERFGTNTIRVRESDLVGRPVGEAHTK